jgi:hypothetical protein
MNLLNIRKVGYGVRSIDELRAPGSRPEPQPTIVTPADNPQRSILDDVRFTSGAAPRRAPPARAMTALRRRRRRSGRRDQRAERGTRHPPGAGALGQ